MDQQLAGMIGGDELVAIGGCLAEPRADDEQQVGLPNALLELRIGAVAEVAGIDRAAVGNRVLAPERRRHRNTVAVREAGEIMRRCRAPVGATDNRDGVGRVLQQVDHRAHRAGASGLRDRRDRRTIDRLDLVAKHVLGNRQHDRPGPTRGRDAVRPSDIFGDTPRVVDPRRPLGDRREEGRHVDFLKPLAVAVGAVEVADENDHRSRILHRDMDPGTGVGRARAAGDEGDAGPPGQLAVGVGHIGDPALLPADDSVDRGRVVERVEDGEEAFAGNGEHPVAPLRDELVNEDAAAGANGLGHAGAMPIYSPRCK